MIKTTNIKVTPAQTSKLSQVDWENLPFGRVFSDHMLVMEYNNGKWEEAEIKEFGNLRTPKYFLL